MHGPTYMANALACAAPMPRSISLKASRAWSKLRRFSTGLTRGLDLAPIAVTSKMSA